MFDVQLAHQATSSTPEKNLIQEERPQGTASKGYFQKNSAQSLNCSTGEEESSDFKNKSFSSGSFGGKPQITEAIKISAGEVFQQHSEEIIKKRQFLIAKKYSGTLTQQEKLDLNFYTWQLNIIASSEANPQIKNYSDLSQTQDSLIETLRLQIESIKRSNGKTSKHW